jgi:hypothetical protein
MPEKFETLARYNGERARGIAHTPEWDAQMAELQREYKEWDESTPWPGMGDRPRIEGLGPETITAMRLKRAAGED